MKKKSRGLLTIIISLCVITGLFGCGNTESSNIDENKNTTDNSEKIVNGENESGANMGGEAENQTQSEEETDENSDKDKKTGSDEGWKSAYINFVKESAGSEDSGFTSGLTYSLIYVNDDDIPELVCNYGVEAAGCQIATYHDGKVDILYTRRLGFDYLEKENKLRNADGNMGAYYDDIYSIENGKWVLIENGSYGDPESGRMQDKDGNDIYEYKWNEVPVSEEEYEKSLKKIYDVSKSKAPKDYYFLGDMLSMLVIGQDQSYTHKYEFFLADVTCSEAKELCEAKGGELAIIDSSTEWGRVMDLIEKEGMTGKTFIIDEKSMDDFNISLDYWLEGEPSYVGKDVNGNEVDEDKLVILYRKSTDRYYLNDVPDDIIGAAPSYKGNIGYICEYE